VSDIVQIKIENEGPFFGAVEKLVERAGDLRSFAPKVSSSWYAHVASTFQSEGGGGWDDLSGAYAEQKAKTYGQQRILHASGRMEEALTSKDAPDSYADETPTELTYGATGRSGELARYHQEGTDTMPARPVYVVTIGYKRGVEDVVMDDLTQYAQSLGLQSVAT
jgi:phage gpG-like protein